MIVKELELTNIRSHGHSLIRFPEGRTLLEGDIGSGKSSVLMAIEFALFGLGSDSGSSVLKLGHDSGEVRMVFDVEGADYEVVRRLQRRSGKVQQSDGYLRTPTETLNLSPSELKEKILEVLEFNEAPDPKAQSWIYRYAVYTPQEEMKSILMLAPEQRLQILRRAFRVEDYKIAATNADETERQIRIDASRLDGVAQGLEALKEEAEQLRREEERCRAELTAFESETSAAEALVEQLRVEREEVRREELSLQGTKAQKEYYEAMRSDSARDAAELADELRNLDDRLSKVDAALGEAGSRRPTRIAPLADLRKKERALEAKAKRLTGLRAAVETKLNDYESIMKRGVCPVCDRPAAAHDFEDKRNGKAAELGHISEELATTEAALTEMRERMEKTEALLKQKEEVALSRSERSRLREEITKKESARRKLEKRIAFADATMLRLAKQLAELEDAVRQGRSTAERLAKAEETLRKARDDLVKASERMESARKQRANLAVEIAAKEEALNKSRRLKEREMWLGDFFLPTVRVIEKSVLTTINQEFDSMFKRWFGMLVTDQDKEVSVDEDFTPIVSQGGYEQDVRYLSGGERTSVALAYRLALNLLAQRVSVGMKSNLLILDEPTDGFSKEQLGNVREVLDEVGCPQVIIVSHDKELESFADQIFRVTKSDGASAVEAPGVS